jgi:hypothetical protein
MKYFEVTISIEKISESGKLVKKNEKYLIDALTFSEAETRINAEMGQYISGEFAVKGIVPKKINELFPNVSCDKWFKAKVNFVTINEEKGVEKKIASYMMVQADDLKEAREHLEIRMKGTMADYEVESINETKIIDVFKYKSN